jgi:hypothetical protein
VELHDGWLTRDETLAAKTTEVGSQ